MNEGKIQQIGSPQDVYYFPQNLFVASFLGSPTMNFLKGDVIQCGGGFAVDILGWQVMFNVIDDNFEASAIIVGFRPEFACIYEGIVENSILGTIVAEESAGSITDYLVKTRSDDTIKIREILFGNGIKSRRYAVGQNVSVVPNSALINLFNLITKERIRAEVINNEILR